MIFDPFSKTPQGNPSENLLHFTNRVTEKAAFNRLLELEVGDVLPVLMFYGVGGTGKTWLSKKLQKDESRDRPTAFISLDPNTGGTDSIDSAKRLINIRKQLGKDIFCPYFDLAYTWLRHKQGAGDEPCFKGEGFLGNVWELITEFGNTASSDIPGGNLLSWIIKKATSPLAGALSDSPWKKWLLESNGQDDYVSLSQRSDDEIYPELTNRLLRDLNENLPFLHGKQARAVIFIDSMESLRTPHDSETKINAVQNWVKELYHPKSPLLIVLSGRDRLIWGDDSGSIFADEKHLEQHIVGGLSANDAREFMINCKIKNTELQNAVLKVSQDCETNEDNGEIGYHPYSLGLCANTIWNLQEQGEVVDPATFDMAPGDTFKLAQRFLKSLGTDSHYELWLKKLALPPRFNELAARCGLGGPPGTVQDAAWKTLRSYSFVQPAGEPGWWKLHAKMRDALEEMMKHSSLHQEYHQWWHELWLKRSASDCDEFASLSWYHHWSLNPKKALEEWRDLAKRERAQLRMQQQAYLLTWWEPIGLDDFSTDHECRRVKGDALNSLGIEIGNSTIGNRTENINEAINYHQSAIRMCPEIKFPKDWASAMNNMGIAYANLPGGDWVENLNQAINCYEESLRVHTKTEFPHDWAMAQNNLGTAYLELPSLDRLENLRVAITHYILALDVYTETDFSQEWATTQNNLGNAYSRLLDGDITENLTQAINCYKSALRVYTESEFPKEWADITHNLGTAFAEILNSDVEKNLTQAIKYYEAALRVYNKIEFPQDWAMAQNSLGNAYSKIACDEMEDYDLAISYYNLALNIHTEMDYPHEWAMAQNNLGFAYHDKSQLDQRQGKSCHVNWRIAEEYYQNAIGGFERGGDVHRAENVRQNLKELRDEMPDDC